MLARLDSLYLRMAGAIGALVVFNVLFVVAMVWVVTRAIPIVLLLAVTVLEPGFIPPFPDPLTLPVSWWTIGSLTAVLLGLHYWWGQQVGIEGVEVRRAGPAEAPKIHEMVETLAPQYGIPKPDVAVANTEVANSMAVGRPGNATVVVSRGMRLRLEDAELEAAIAHELAHVANGDSVVMASASLLARITDALHAIAWKFTRESPSAGYFAPLVVVIGVLLATIAKLFWLGSTTVYRLLGQYRELVADRTAARVTGSPATVAGAIRSLAEDPAPPSLDFRRAHGDVAPLCFMPHGLPETESEDDEPASTDATPPAFAPVELVPVEGTAIEVVTDDFGDSLPSFSYDPTDTGDAGAEDQGTDDPAAKPDLEDRFETLTATPVAATMTAVVQGTPLSALSVPEGTTTPADGDPYPSFSYNPGDADGDGTDGDLEDETGMVDQVEGTGETPEKRVSGHRDSDDWIPEGHPPAAQRLERLRELEREIEMA